MCVNDVLQWSAEVLLACVPAGEVSGDGAMGHRLMSAPGLAMVRVVVDAWLCDSRAELRRQGEPCIDVSPGVQPRPQLDAPDAPRGLTRHFPSRLARATPLARGTSPQHLHVSVTCRCAGPAVDPCVIGWFERFSSFHIVITYLALLRFV